PPRSLDQRCRRVIPAARELRVGNRREVERVDDQRRRVDAAEARGDAAVDCVVVEPCAFPAQAADQAEPAHRQPTISSGLKKNAISILAFSSLSEPWTELASMPSAKVLRIVPSAASAGLVAPITSRLRFTASSPSSTCTTTGPLVMKSHSSPKNGRSWCTA